MQRVDGGCTEGLRMVARYTEGPHGTVARYMEGVWRACEGHAEGVRMVATYMEGLMEWLLGVQRVCGVCMEGPWMVCGGV